MGRDISHGLVKGLVHPSNESYPMIYSPSSHPKCTVYYFILSDKYNRSYLKKCPGSSKLYNGSGQVFIYIFFKSNKVHPSIIKKYSTRLREYILSGIDVFV